MNLIIATLLRIAKCFNQIISLRICDACIGKGINEHTKKKKLATTRKKARRKKKEEHCHLHQKRRARRVDPIQIKYKKNVRKNCPSRLFLSFFSRSSVNVRKLDSRFNLLANKLVHTYSHIYTKHKTTERLQGTYIYMRTLNNYLWTVFARGF